MRILIACLAVLLLMLPMAVAAPGDTGGEQPGSKLIGDGVVVPGQRIGTIRLAMSVEQIIGVLGTRFKRQEFEPEKIILYEWRTEGVWVSLNMETKATRVISVFGANTGYKTDKEISLLMPFDRAEAVYGKGYKRWEYKEDKITLIRYTELGLQFGVVNDPSQKLLHGRIFQIGIFKPGDLPPARQP